MLIAAAAMASVSCLKSEVQTPDSAEFVLTFASEKPEFDDVTRTEWNGETVQWSEGDKISVAYTVDGVWQNAGGDASDDAKLYKSEALEADAEVARFNVSTAFYGTTSGRHVFYGIYPAPESANFPSAPEAVLTLPVVQTPGADSFDSRGDLMVGVSGEYATRPSEGETISLKWNRLVAHAHITLKTLNGFTAGENVTGITLMAQDGANLVGQQKVNVCTGEVVADNAASNVLNLVGDGLIADASGNVTFWACVLPAKVTSLKVQVNTNKATYTRDISSCDFTFKQNARNTLTIKMEGATREERVAEAWTLVTPSRTLSAGTYVMVVKTSTKTGALISSNGSNAAPTFYTTGLSIDGTSLNGVTDAMKFDISGAKDSYKIAVAGQTTNYLYTNNANNGVRVGNSTNNNWKITAHSTNGEAFMMQSTYTSRYLGVYNNQDWRCYTDYNATNFTSESGSSQIYLYKKTNGAASDTPVVAPTITVAETLTLQAGESEGAIEVTCDNAVSVEVNAYADEACTLDCNWLETEWTGSGVAYSAGENDGDTRTAYVRICARSVAASEVVALVEVTQTAKGVVPDVPSFSVTPAVNQDWLELPGAATGGDYVVNTYYDGSNRNYTHLYDKNTYTSLWTAYALNSSHMGSESRPGSWSYSPSIETSYQVNLKSHSYNDNYSRGHLIPNASRNGIKAMQLQTFYVTNSVPQIQNSFNSGIWSNLENALQSIGKSEEIYIVTGVTFNKVGENKTINYTTAKDDTKQVPVPNYFYKVVLKVEKSGNTVTSASAIGFWFEHKTYSDSYTNYTVSVDQIEQWTGFDFFVNLPDTIESAAESNTNWTNFQNF